jgi:hypothetical protein
LTLLNFFLQVISINIAHFGAIGEGSVLFLGEQRSFHVILGHILGKTSKDIDYHRMHKTGSLFAIEDKSLVSSYTLEQVLGLNVDQPAYDDNSYDYLMGK